MTSRMRVPAVQIQSIVRSMRDGASRAGGKTVWLTIIPTIVLGAWTLWIYLTVGRLQQQLSTEQLQLTVAEAKEGRIATTHALRLEPLGAKPNQYRGEFQIAVANPSRRPVEVSWVVFELYLGRMQQELAANSVLAANEPPKRELDMQQPGPITWQYQSSHGFVYDQSKLLKRANFRQKYFRKGGGLTGTLVAGAQLEYTLPLWIDGSPDTWLGVVAIFGMDGAEEGEGVRYVSEWVELSEATRKTD